MFMFKWKVGFVRLPHWFPRVVLRIWLDFSWLSCFWSKFWICLKSVSELTCIEKWPDPQSWWILLSCQRISKLEKKSRLSTELTNFTITWINIQTSLRGKFAKIFLIQKFGVKAWLIRQQMLVIKGVESHQDYVYFIYLWVDFQLVYFVHICFHKTQQIMFYDYLSK